MSVLQLPVSFRLLLFSLFVLLSQESLSQTCTPTYKKTYDGNGIDEGLDIIQTKEGGSLVAGRTTSNATNFNGFLLKLREDGSIEWSNTYGGTGYDEIIRVKQTLDGGYIALGNKHALDESRREAWFFSVDQFGTLRWSKLLALNGVKVRGKDIIELKDGGFAIALNLDDSTDKGDGMILRTTPDGNIIWSKRFDHGGNDGFNRLVQDADQLLVTGYTTLDKQDGLISCLKVDDGSTIWSKRLFRRSGQYDDVLNIARIPGGYSFGVSTKYTPTSSSAVLYLFKMKDDGSIYYARRTNVSSRSGNGFGQSRLIFTPDEGFTFLSNDTTASTNGMVQNINAAGMGTWGQYSPGYYINSSYYGVDTYGKRGHLVTGGFHEATWPVSSPKIQVLKLDLIGKHGDCSRENNLSTLTDTIHNFGNEAFTWQSIRNGAITLVALSLDVLPITFNANTVCERMDCEPTSTNVNESCYATFLYHYPAQFKSVPFGIQKFKNGYFITGYIQNFAVEGQVTRLHLNGAVDWSKTLNPFIHRTSYQMMRETDDGNLLLIGPDNVVINHGSSTSMIITKITINGTVLWSRTLDGTFYDLQPMENGIFTGILMSTFSTSASRIKIDRDGNIIYSKYLGGENDLMPIYRKIIVQGNDLFAAGEMHGHLVIDKLDSAGNRVWSNLFKPEDKAYNIESFHLIGDSLYSVVRHRAQENWINKDYISMVKVGVDGKGLNAFALNQSTLVPDPSTYWFWPQTRIFRATKTADNNFVIADRAPNGSDSLVIITKFSGTGQVIWSKKYPMLNRHRIMDIKDDEGSLLVLGYRIVSDPSYQNLSSEPMLMRLTKDGEITSTTSLDCKTQTNAATTSPLYINELIPRSNPIPTFRYANHKTVATALLEVPLKVGAQLACGIPADCSMLKIKGAVSLCQSDEIITFETIKNAGCVLPAFWLYDTTFIQLIKATDSTLAVKFKRDGMVKIYTSYNTGCGILYDSIAVRIAPQSSKLNLGKDTSLCPGNTLILNARAGYASYQWQDGSADSIYRVRTPGIYHVEVQDACGESFRDTVYIKAAPPIPFDAGPDRVKCNGDTLHIDAPAGFMNYQWEHDYRINTTTGANVVVNPLIDTAYYIRAEKTPGCFAYDTVRIRVHHSPVIRLGNDTFFCQGSALMLDAGSGFASYQWNTGAIGQHLTVTERGKYSIVGITTEGCRSYDTLLVTEVHANPIVELGANKTLCAGSKRSLDAGSFKSYQWNDGSRERTLMVDKPGQYWVQVQDVKGCTAKDTLVIDQLLAPPKEFLPHDTAICSYGTLMLKPFHAYTQYTWSNGSRNSSISIDRPGTYSLEVKDAAGCIGRDEIVVSSKECMKGLFVPNAFTPNKDGKNDLFKAMLFGAVKEFQLTVYNRWGEVIFQTNDRQKGWDGNYNGRQQDNNVFVWICRYQLEGEEVKTEKGSVVLIR